MNYINVRLKADE